MNDGGPVFPRNRVIGYGAQGAKIEAFLLSEEEGMSVLDSFAGKALAALIRSRGDAMQCTFHGGDLGVVAYPSNAIPQDLARAAYGYADAMVGERDRRRQPPPTEAERA